MKPTAERRRPRPRLDLQPSIKLTMKSRTWEREGEPARQPCEAQNRIQSRQPPKWRLSVAGALSKNKGNSSSFQKFLELLWQTPAKCPRGDDALRLPSTSRSRLRTGTQQRQRRLAHEAWQRARIAQAQATTVLATGQGTAAQQGEVWPLAELARLQKNTERLRTYLSFRPLHFNTQARKKAEARQHTSGCFQLR